MIDIQVLLISGKAGSGKDHYAEYIKQKLETDTYKIKITHFADYLKYILTKYKHWDGQKDENGRNLLNIVGNGVRLADDCFWARVLSNEIAIAEGDYDLFIVPDLRFKSELKEFTERFDCKAIRINMNRESPLTESQQRNMAEVEFDDCSKETFACFVDSEKDIDNFLEEMNYGKH